LKKQGDHVYVEVWDDGKGFDLQGVLSHYPKSKRFGLATITERVRLIGGALEVRSQEGAGTCISFTVPIEGEGKNASLSNFVG
jgi:two-component system sensor histidine kinase ComP